MLIGVVITFTAAAFTAALSPLRAAPTKMIRDRQASEMVKQRHITKLPPRQREL